MRMRDGMRIRDENAMRCVCNLRLRETHHWN